MSEHEKPPPSGVQTAGSSRPYDLLTDSSSDLEWHLDRVRDELLDALHDALRNRQGTVGEERDLATLRIRKKRHHIAAFQRLRRDIRRYGRTADYVIRDQAYYAFACLITLHDDRQYLVTRMSMHPGPPFWVLALGMDDAERILDALNPTIRRQPDESLH